jgi:O-glycosyl hydrolase
MNFRILFPLLVSILLWGTFSCSHKGRSGSSPTLTVMPAAYQRVKGWGVFPGYMNRSWSAYMIDKPQIQDIVYGEMGMTVARMKIIPQFYRDGTLDTALIDKTFIAQLQNLKDRGITRYITVVWSPPVDFKKCKTISGICPDGSENRLEENHEEAYVRFITQLLNYIEYRWGSLPEYHSIQNETGYAPRWDGCRYTVAQWRRVILKLRESFDTHGLDDLAIMGPESGFSAPKDMPILNGIVIGKKHISQ